MFALYLPFNFMGFENICNNTVEFLIDLKRDFLASLDVALDASEIVSNKSKLAGFFEQHLITQICLNNLASYTYAPSGTLTTESQKVMVGGGRKEVTCSFTQ